MIECEIIYKKVKRITLKVDYTLKVKVICPDNCTKEEITTFVSQKEKWIQKQLAYFKKLNYKEIPLQPDEILVFGSPYKYIYAAGLTGKTQFNHDTKMIYTANLLLQKRVLSEWYQKLADLFLKERVKKLAEQYHFTCYKVSVRNQKTRWGSCSSTKNISLNWKLIKTPLWVIDYVILHELAHTVHLNHSAEFWNLVEKVCPYYRQAEEWLRQYEHQL
jgi:predicted metal-dependent hydrolase